MIRGQSRWVRSGALLGLAGRIAMGASPRSASLTQRRKRFAFNPPCQRHCGDRYAGLLALTHRFSLEEYAMVPPSAAPGRDSSVHVSTKPTC